MAKRMFGRQAAREAMNQTKEWGPRQPGVLSQEDTVKLMAFMKRFMLSTEYKNASNPQEIALIAFSEWQRQNP